MNPDRLEPQLGRTDRIAREVLMAWTTPEVTEICLGMEVTSYAPALS